MNNNKNTWSSNIGLIISVGVTEILLITLISIFPTASFFFIPLMAIILIAAIVKIRRNVSDAEFAEKMEKLQKESSANAGAGQTTSSFYNKSASTSVGASSASAVSNAANASQAPFFGTLKNVAREYSQKALKQKYASYESMQDVCEKLNAYTLSRGIKLGEKSAEALVMAMVSSKCIFVKKTSENTEDILSIAGEFFSGENSPCLALEAIPVRPLGLVYFYQDKLLTCTEFFKKVYASAFIENTVCLCTLKDLADIRFGSIFADFISMFKNPYGETACPMAPVTASDLPKFEDRKFTLPHNTWFFFLLNGDEHLPEDIALWSETIEVSGVGSKSDSPTPAQQAMAYSQFNELIDGAYDENFLPLETWKKLDKLEDYMHGAVGVKIDNILARQIERITTMQVACGSTHAQAMDIAIARKVLPLLSGYTKEQVDQEGTTLKEVLDGLFGVENLPECHKALSALQLD